MCCPRCESRQLHVALPAIGDQEPIMACDGCGVFLTSDVLGLYVDQLLDRELVTELKELLKAA